MNPNPAPSSDPSNKVLLRVLRGETLTVPPIWLMRQAGRYLPEYRALRETVGGFLDLCLTPELAAEVTLQPVRRFALDAAILFSDILIVPYALGQALEYRDGEGPVLDPLRSPAAIAAVGDADFRDRIAPVWRTVERVKTLLPDAMTLIGFAGAPWTVASYMVEGGTSRDFVKVKSWAFSDAAGFGGLIDRLVEATIVYLDGQVRAGADMVQLFDSWAGVLPEAAFRQWVIAPTKKIVAALKEAHPRVPIVGFPRGAGLMYRDYVVQTGVDGVSLDQTVPLEIARRTLQPLAALQGNLDPLLLVAGGDAMAEAVRAIVATLGGGPFIFNLGHGVTPATPPDHVKALIELVRGGATP
jgi:uroporphyrinogen decarboxylase